MKKILLMLPLLLAIGGCNGRGESGAPSLDMMAQASAPTTASINQRPRMISTDSALAHLPESAGLPKVARDRLFANGYWQQILLASDVANADSHIEIAIQSGRTIASANKAPVWKPGEAGIREELAHEFPNMRMLVVADGDYENQFGRFGLAIGRQGDDLRCVYAWQYVDDGRRIFADGRRIPLDGAEAAPAVLRIKLCRADSTVDDLVGYVRKLTVEIPANYGAIDAVAAPMPLSAPSALTADATRGRLAEAPPSRKRARKHHAAVARANREAWASGWQPQVVVAPQQAPYPPAAQGLRYMAPIAVPSVVPTPTGGSPVSLPPQAYRGPGASQASIPSPQNPYHRPSVVSADPVVRETGPSPASAPGGPRIIPLTMAPDRSS
jgi:hypothetical protein